MAKLKFQGSATGTGTVTLVAPTTDSTRTITLPDDTTTLTGAPVGLDDVSGVARATSGLLFNGDTAAANALDDYETGTFTATLTGATTAPATACTCTSSYVKVGDIVTVSGHFANVDSTGASGYIKVTGLPFVSYNLTSVRPVGAFWHNRVSVSNPIGFMSYNTSEITPVGSNSGNSVSWGSTGSTYSGFTLTYRTS